MGCEIRGKVQRIDESLGIGGRRIKNEMGDRHQYLILKTQWYLHGDGT